MRIYLKNNSAKFHDHRDPIWDDGILRIFEERHPNKNNHNNNHMSSDMGSVPGPKIYMYIETT